MPTIKQMHFDSAKARAEFIRRDRSFRGHIMAARNKARRSGSEDDISSFLVLIESENRLREMLKLISGKPDDVFWPVFQRWWPSCDATWDFNDLLTMLLRRAGSSIPFLDHEGQTFLASLPDPVIVYRGCSRERARGIAWTTDVKVAESFARGHRGIRVPDAVVASGVVRKKDIFTVFTDREESEVLCRPEGVELHNFSAA